MTRQPLSRNERAAAVLDGLATAIRDPECPVQFSPLLMEARKLLSGELAADPAPQTQGQPGEWQPIETAEKTGEARLLACPLSIRTLGFWGKGVSEPEGSQSWRDCFRWKPIKPTHWMPLPSAPPAAADEPPRVIYDASGDVLYVTIEDVPAARATETSNGAVRRFDGAGNLIGVTFIDFIERHCALVADSER